jgi:protein SCO1/2
MLSNLGCRLARRLASTNTLGLYPRQTRLFAKRPEDFISSPKKDAGAEETKGPGKSPEAEDGDERAAKNPFDEDEATYVNQKKTGYYFFIGAGVTMAGLYFIMQLNANKKPKRSAMTTTGMGRAHIGGPWELVGLDGKKFGSQDLDGKYYLIYFGFTRCPDVCPQSLFKLTKALEMVRKSPESKYFELETVFVTIDPDRDGKEQIQKFLKNFDKQIIPVTAKSNNDPVLRQMMSKFKIHSSKIELEEEDPTDSIEPKPYTLDHTIITYLMDDENQYLTHIGSNMSSSEAASHIISKVVLNQREKLIRK